MVNTPEPRLDRVEESLERATRLLERLIDVQGNFLITQEQHEQRLGLLTQNLIELRAGQQRQDRILDYLMRRDGGQN
jgi:hypothetical protein